MARPRVREKLLDAAYGLLQQNGVTAMTTRHIAHCAGTTEASVFNNFGDKTGLLYALIRERLPEVREVKFAIKAELDDDIVAWLQSVYMAAKSFYIAIIPLTASLWGRKNFNDGAMAEHYSLHAMLLPRFLELQQSGTLSSKTDAGVLATIFLGSALHNSFHFLAQGDGAVNGQSQQESKQVVLSILPLFTEGVA
ncbi:HTH-type transcriptional regulator BetI [Zhongshania aliphaticivorans]|uniref:HTH-type transcriptional regulator BetI n=1 Tax=Zhongshania aliphaticivorans TaxID=1470434 RepID=A0A5S9Q671_9GAMM|nr:TetR/AcrR family transcriptional regulator [Zhongshania aliphaticivorans]CAA0094880.1 HTH-type transcriptional regulator BetI [Zhongshania aliphaticivorans]CAA0112733.1 HTH-type transcriptional regulator BetI [Zhongshania aliphaticivorans]